LANDVELRFTSFFLPLQEAADDVRPSAQLVVGRIVEREQVAELR
jgi:hypothetical protein